MDGLKGDVEGLKGDMEGLKESLKNLLQERIYRGDMVIHENYDGDERNINYDFRDSNVGFKTHHIPKINMRKFHGKDMVTWILQMEKSFDLHDVQHKQKVCITYLYLEPN